MTKDMLFGYPVEFRAVVTLPEGPLDVALAIEAHSDVITIKPCQVLDAIHESRRPRTVTRSAAIRALRDVIASGNPEGWDWDERAEQLLAEAEEQEG